MPIYLAADKQGNVIVSDNVRIRKIDTNLVVSLLAGSGNQAYQDGTGIFCSFRNAHSITVDPVGNAFVFDSYSASAIRKVTPQGEVTTFAGSPFAHPVGDGMGTNASFFGGVEALNLGADSLGNLFVTDNQMVRKVSSSGLVTTVAGSVSGYNDGSGQSALFAVPTGLSLDSSNRIYVADAANQRIRRITYGQVPTNAFSISMYAGLSLSGPIGTSFRVDYTTSLSGSNATAWTPAATIRLTSNPQLWFDADSPGQQKRFYRAVPLP